MPGVVRTRVGYAGGKKKSPNYHDLGDHTESIQVDYNPKKIAYEELLDAFWKSHDPSRRCSRQYMSAIFYLTEEQKKTAEASMEKYNKTYSKTAKTEILPLTAETFYVAEDYHQKYYLRHSEFMKFFKFLKNSELRESPAATKVNAFCGGDLKRQDLVKELTEVNVDKDLLKKLEQGSLDIGSNSQCSPS